MSILQERAGSGREVLPDPLRSVVIDAVHHHDWALWRVQRDWMVLTFLQDLVVPVLVPSWAPFVAGFRGCSCPAVD